MIVFPVPTYPAEVLQLRVVLALHAIHLKRLEHGFAKLDLIQVSSTVLPEPLNVTDMLVQASSTSELRSQIP